MNATQILGSSSHGGILVPFDMFRLTQLASIWGELLASKARNILDARLVAVRYEPGNLLLLRIEGHVVGDDPAEFWRGNPDLALITSQALPHRVLMYWAQPGPAGQRREGFLFAQRGQVIASDEATEDRARSGENAWPVTRLCEQMRISMTDLADAFPGSPRVEVPLVEASDANDQELLMTLVGREAAGGLGADEIDASGGPAQSPAPAATAQAPARPGGPAMGAGARPGQPGAQARPGPAQPKFSVEEDTKRRATEAAAEAAEQRKRAQEVQADLPYVVDELGIVMLPKAGLGEPDMIRALVSSELRGELPPGLPSSLADSLQGKRSDIAVPVEFLSEVFVDDNKPLSKPMLAERATQFDAAGRSLSVIEVLAPRVGYGSLVSDGRKHVFVSRKPESKLPVEVVLRLLDGA
jgi:hypothetical protein